MTGRAMVACCRGGSGAIMALSHRPWMIKVIRVIRVGRIIVIRLLVTATLILSLSATLRKD